ncbi:MAG: hypothetical protein R2940_03120 [Syntrophotaleaceae bacterium]
MELENLLQLSLQQYRDLLNKLEEIGGMLKKGQGDAVGVSLQGWMQLRDEAHLIDGRIADLLTAKPETPLPSSFLATKRSLMTDLADRCQEILTQATAHKALVRDELAQLREGRTAISGYKTPSSYSGSRVSSRQ